MEQVDVLVIGGGILGLATAYQLLQQGVRNVTLIEKERHVAAHQTGHNSGVLHSGIYYAPGSLKAQIASKGKDSMVAFCREAEIPFELCGKLVVAATAEEEARLTKIEERARANGVSVERTTPARMKEIEPEVAGTAALFVPGTGIVDFRVVCSALSERIQRMGGKVTLTSEFVGATHRDQEVIVETTQDPISARLVVAAAGLHADHVARKLGLSTEIQIVPFRGEYYALRPESTQKVRGLIYPVPDPKFPFLGVHFTRRITGMVDCGPNAVLSFGRESYEKSQISWKDLGDTLMFRGFRKLAWQNLGYGASELYRSYSKSAFTRSLQKLVPSVEKSDLIDAPAGIRAQAVSTTGELIHDFVIEERPRVLCMLNAPSPAATASLEIGRLLAERAIKQLV